MEMSDEEFGKFEKSGELKKIIEEKLRAEDNVPT